MFCRGQTIGLALICLGVSLLIGSLLPSCVLLWLCALALIAAGVLLFNR